MRALLLMLASIGLAGCTFVFSQENARPSSSGSSTASSSASSGASGSSSTSGSSGTSSGSSGSTTGSGSTSGGSGSSAGSSASGSSTGGCAWQFVESVEPVPGRPTTAAAGALFDGREAIGVGTVLDGGHSGGSGSPILTEGYLDAFLVEDGGALAGGQLFDTGMKSVISLLLADLDGDGQPDVAVADDADNLASVLHGQADGGLGAAQVYSLASVCNTPTSIAADDFNADGWPDLAFACAEPLSSSNSMVALLQGEADGGFSGPTSITVGPNPVAVAAGNFNADLYGDLAVAKYGDGYVNIYLGSDAGLTEPFTDIGTGAGTGASAIAAGEFTAASVPDLAMANFALMKVHIMEGQGNGSFQDNLEYSTPFGPSAIAIGHGGDGGAPYVVVANADETTLQVITLNQTASALDDGGLYSDGFVDGGNAFAYRSPQAIAVGDFNGDGRDDFAIAGTLTDGGGALAVFLSQCR